MKTTLSLLALLGLSVNALAINDKTVLSTDKAPAPIGTYSQASVTQYSVYISGQIGIDPATGKLVEGFDAQAVRALTNLAAIVDAAGADIDDIVKVTIFLADLSDFAALNKHYATYFTEPYPARSVVEVQALPKGALVEIEAILSKSK